MDAAYGGQGERFAGELTGASVVCLRPSIDDVLQHLVEADGGELGDGSGSLSAYLIATVARFEVLEPLEQRFAQGEVLSPGDIQDLAGEFAVVEIDCVDPAAAKFPPSFRARVNAGLDRSQPVGTRGIQPPWLGRLGGNIAGEYALKLRGLVEHDGVRGTAEHAYGKQQGTPPYVDCFP